MQTAELVMKHSSETTAEAKSLPPGFKSMLFHVHNDDGLDDRLQIALTMARAFGAHLHLLHVTPIEAYSLNDGFTNLVSTEVIDILESESSDLKSRLEHQLGNEDVSWSYEQITGSEMPRLIQRAALADLVFVSRQPYSREFGPAGISLLGDMLHRIKSPLFLPGDLKAEFDPFGPAMVAWNGSYEAANALRAAIPMLKIASRVRLVSVEEAKEDQFPSTAALEYLSRHGIHAELVQRPLIADATEDQLLDHAIGDRVSYMVMGGYGHTRAGEFFFGGVTRSLLRECPTSLVIAH